MKICINCEDRPECSKICPNIKNILKNLKRRNGIYSDTTFHTMNITTEDAFLERILYISNTLSEDEQDYVRKVCITILTPLQKRILDLLSSGITQESIAKKLNLSQSSVSQKIKVIKKEISSQFHSTIDKVPIQTLDKNINKDSDDGASFDI